MDALEHWAPALLEKRRWHLVPTIDAPSLPAQALIYKNQGIPPPRMKVVVGGVDSGGKSRLLSALIKVAEDRVNGTTSVPPENTIYEIETNSKDPRYAKRFEFWEDSKNAQDRGALNFGHLRIMKSLVDIALICFPLDAMAQVSDLGHSLEERISARIDDMIAGMEIADRCCKPRKNPAVFLVGCRSDLLGGDAVDPSRKKNVLCHRIIKQLVAESGVHGYFECSAITGTGVGELLDAIVDATLHPPKKRLQLPKDLSIAGKRTRHCIIL
jgi:GTPase SAR1 family protein